MCSRPCFAGVEKNQRLPDYTYISTGNRMELDKKMNQIARSIFKKVTKKQCLEFGQVAVLICLFLALYQRDFRLVPVAFILICITILLPLVFYPLAVIWFGLAVILGAVSSRLILTGVFLLMVLPVSLFRRLTGKDSLRIKQFKKATQSVMVTRDHVFVPEDLQNTF